ncbi:MAG: hypothetical protein WBI07_10480 [Mobilitalea sp.]
MIGGEFEILINNLDDINSSSEKTLEGFYDFSSGRAALYHILIFLKTNKNINSIMLPDYLCPSIIKTVNELDINIVFFPLNEQLQLDEEKFTSLYSKGAIVLLINYFGITKMIDQINFIKSIDPDAIIIEDQVQAFYSFLNTDHKVDFKFTSLRKTFAIPDGGLTKTPYSLSTMENKCMFSQYKFAGGILKSLRDFKIFNDDIYLDLLDKGEHLIDSDLFSSMSDISKRLFTKTDFSFIQNIRKKNSDYLISGLNDLGISTILKPDKDEVALFIPILINDRNRVRRKMFENQIYCPVHWPLEDINLVTGNLMQEHELSLIVDQRYGTKEMDLILSILEGVKNVI